MYDDKLCLKCAPMWNGVQMSIKRLIIIESRTTQLPELESLSGLML